MSEPLPSFVAPMLAKSGSPFDSDDHLFEIKWDGTRALLFVDSDGPRLVNRRERNITERYPEREQWGDLPEGLVLDGELVVLRDGVPDFSALLSREQSRKPRRIASLAATLPATYVAFDLLYCRGASLLDRPLSERRMRLRELLGDSPPPSLVFSDGVTGSGVAYFERAVDSGLEGIVAKRLDSRYLPGRRTDAWTKIKRQERRLCAVIGLSMRGKELRSLIVAISEGGGLRCVGRVGSGLTEAKREELVAALPSVERSDPVVECRHVGRWVEPVWFCDVSYLEMTSNGELRAPVLRGWVDPDEA